VRNKNTCIGTGLVALDVILNGKPETLPKLTAGGSCGNVLTILSFFGWKSYPIARFANNLATREIEEDLKRWKVGTNLISKTDDGSTPVIIHRILKDKQGKPKHRFEFRDPESGKWFPQYKPVLSKDVPFIVQEKPTSSNIFYFDRVNRASVELAKFYKNQGAIVFFEPSSIGDKEKLFKECLESSHIVKFSSERMKNYSTVFKTQQAPLEIETLGKDGVRFRFSLKKKAIKWSHIPGFKIADVLDSAGAGDWCSAGIIDSIYRKGKSGFNGLNLKDIKSSIEFGQALGALNCYFDGARGIMYNLSKTQTISVVKKTIQTGKIDLLKVKFTQTLVGKSIKIKELFNG
jgi:fructokinase